MKIKDLPFNHGYFWSYDKESEVSDSVIISQVLIYGDIDEICQLIHRYGYDKCKGVFDEKLARAEKKYPKTINFLRIFFEALQNVD